MSRPSLGEVKKRGESVGMCSNVRERNGKDCAQLQLAVSLLLVINQKTGPNGRTYMQNISDLILHEKESVYFLQPIMHHEFQLSIRLQT